MCSQKLIIIILCALIILYILTKLNKNETKKENLTPLDSIMQNANSMAKTATNSALNVLNIKKK